MTKNDNNITTAANCSTSGADIEAVRAAMEKFRKLRSFDVPDVYVITADAKAKMAVAMPVIPDEGVGHISHLFGGIPFEVCDDEFEAIFRAGQLSEGGKKIGLIC